MKMIKRYVILLSALVLALSIAGCKEEPTPPVEVPVDNPAAILTVLNEGEAVELAAYGRSVYTHVAGGGDLGETQPAPITIDGMSYRYLGADIDTMDKLTAYLATAFTPAAIEKFIADSGIKEQDGKTIQPDADGGSLLEWENAAASKISGDATKADFELKVPYGEGQDVEFEPVTVSYELIDEYWRIASVPSEIY